MGVIELGLSGVSIAIPLTPTLSREGEGVFGWKIVSGNEEVVRRF